MINFETIYTKLVQLKIELDIFFCIRWKVLDSDESIEKWTLFSRLKSGCPISVKCIEEEDREFPNASKS